MPLSDFNGDGYTQRRTDTLRMRWLKILGKKQAVLSNPSAANHPTKNDTVRVIKQKLLNALNGTSYNG